MPMGEYDKRVVILTKENGRISAFAKGARRPNSALLACTQPFTFGRYNLYVGRNSYSIVSAEIDNYFSEIRDDLSSVYYGMYFCEFADYITKEDNNEKEILRLLYVSLLALIKGIISKELIRVIFELKILYLSGLSPHVFSCVKCNKNNTKFYYSFETDGLTCKECRDKHNIRTVNITKTTIYTMQYIVNSNIKSLYSFNVAEQIIKELKIITKSHKDKYIQYNFKSYEMLEHIISINL